MNNSSLTANGSSSLFTISQVTTPACMFAVGVFSNLVAIVVLCVSRKEKKETTFYTLVCGLAVTDLLGTCLTSPIVIDTYLAGFKWRGGQPLCDYFAFMLLFFGLAGMSILCAMAVERYLAINHPYLYGRHVRPATGRWALLAVYALNVLLCALPSMGVGRCVRQHPDTWCYIDWKKHDGPQKAFAFTYAVLSAALVLVTVCCNACVCAALVAMRRRAAATRVAEEAARHGPRRSSPGGPGRFAVPAALAFGGTSVRQRRFALGCRLSGVEVQMMCLLVAMTAVFVVCSVPLVVRIFVNQLSSNSPQDEKSSQKLDLQAIRMASFNPILDPWVYILCRRKLLGRCVHLCRRLLCKMSENNATRPERRPPGDPVSVFTLPAPTDGTPRMERTECTHVGP
ncbi:prostaglandin E2 receptor EP4 subtype-like [Lampetra fluviatilis]